MKTLSAKSILKASGLTVVIERDATATGYEYVVERSGRSLCGWTDGNKTDAYEQALSDARNKGFLQ